MTLCSTAIRFQTICSRPRRAPLEPLASELLKQWISTRYPSLLGLKSTTNKFRRSLSSGPHPNSSNSSRTQISTKDQFHHRDKKRPNMHIVNSASLCSLPIYRARRPLRQQERYRLKTVMFCRRSLLTRLKAQETIITLTSRNHMKNGYN
jgi:hypothetical protein